MRRCIFQKIHYLIMSLESRSHKTLSGTLYIVLPMHLQSLKFYIQQFRRRFNYKKHDIQTHRQTARRRTDFGTKLIYVAFFSKEKSCYKNGPAPWQPCFLTYQIKLSNLGRGSPSPKDHLCQVISKSGN